MKEPDATDRTAVQFMDEGMFQFQHFYWYSGLMNVKIRIHTHIILHSAELYTQAVLSVSSCLGFLYNYVDLGAIISCDRQTNDWYSSTSL